MSFTLWFQAHRRELRDGVIGALLALILVVIFLYTPRPRLVDAPASTKESRVTLNGIAAPRVGVVAFDDAGNALLAVNANDNGEFTLSNLPIGEGRNTFRLRAVASRVRVSLPVTVVIAKDTVAPSLAVNALAGATVTGSNTVLSGKAEPGSVVTVNGVRATVNPDGTWTAAVALKSGSNTVAASATDPAGNTTTNTQTIQYAPSAADSQTGTATVTASSTATSPGSQPAPTSTSTTPGVTSPSGTATSSATSPTASPTGSPTALTPPPVSPAPQPVLAIVATAWVSNPRPNARANETIYASVKDNYGRPVSDASVIASVYYKSGMQNYSLSSLGNGQYSVSFKLNDKFTSGYRVAVDVTARSNGFTSTAATSFTPE